MSNFHSYHFQKLVRVLCIGRNPCGVVAAGRAEEGPGAREKAGEASRVVRYRFDSDGSLEVTEFSDGLVCLVLNDEAAIVEAVSQPCPFTVSVAETRGCGEGSKRANCHLRSKCPICSNVTGCLIKDVSPAVVVGCNPGLGKRGAEALGVAQCLSLGTTESA